MKYIVHAVIFMLDFRDAMLAMDFIYWVAYGLMTIGTLK